jgi:hypothetical protein
MKSVARNEETRVYNRISWGNLEWIENNIKMHLMEIGSKDVNFMYVA